MLIAKFAYNNIKNISTSYTLFKLNFGIYFWVSYKKNINPQFKFKVVDKLATELKKLSAVYRKNL